ncbi:MAG TPA: TonB-dependent receptor [Rhodanobacteraceae bacterium]|nr:TonB-dependent receptor [Rhodanobacteraceae bacterium]
MSNKISAKAGHGLRRTALVLALGACFASTAVFAQSRSAGSIFGTADAGSQVTIVSKDTGLTRTATVGSNGRYNFTELPTGTYTVSAVNNGSSIGTRESVAVGVGGTEIDFSAQNLSSMTVSASAMPSIDVSQVDTRTTLTAQILNQVPIARDITQAAVLAPSVVPADSRYGNSASFGGSAASENAYYINGYPVTNALTNIGSTTLPFDAIESEQVITGGYSARYGRSTGGVINVVTKAGSNQWKAGGVVSWQPESLRNTRKSIYYPNDTGATSDGTLYRDRSVVSDDSLTYGIYASGPLIKDRLFFYATGEWEDEQLNQGSAKGAAASQGWSENHEKSPRWLAKLDWNINNNNIVEFTGISDKTTQQIDYKSWDWDNSTHGDTVNGTGYYKDGGETYIGKYTGYLTDTLTLSAMYGSQKVVHYTGLTGYDPSQIYVSDTRPDHAANPVTGLQPYLTFQDPQAFDKTDGYRVDLEWRVGDHDLSVGYDVANSEARTGTITSGPGYAWNYYNAGDEGVTEQGNFPVPSANGDYVRKYQYANGGQFKVEQKAYYLEDRWQLTDRWLLSLGVRNDSFSNYNSDGIIYVEQKNQWAPRVGFTWDVFGDSSMKVFGNAGRYFLAMPLNVAVRGAAGSTYIVTYYTFTGIDPATGVPQGLTEIGGPYSSNNEFGQAPDPRTVAAQDLKSHYQDEFILGMQQALGSSWNWGARFQYRDLKSAIDDQCDNRPMLKYMAENNIAIDPNYSFSPDCRLFNPGANNVMLLDIPDAAGSTDLVPVPFSAKDMGMHLKRRYVGVDLFLEHPFDGTWFGRVDYTWAHNYGNDEGQLNSDIGQGDVSQTVLFDHKELMEYGDGDLPNDRRHTIKAYGFYQFSPEFQVGGTLVAKTGRPKSCLGYYTGADTDAYNPPQAGTSSGQEYWANYLSYGRYYHYCGGKPVPRGSVGRLPTDVQLSLNAAYIPSWADGNLRFQVDVFNVFNKQVAQNVEERGENGGVGVVASNRFRVISYDAPRSVRLSARYDFSL